MTAEGGLTSADPGIPRYCGSCGAPRDAASTNFCRSCGVPYADPDRLTPLAPASLAFAPKVGFWRRTFAYVLDTLVLIVIGFFFGVIVGVIGAATEMPEADLTLIAQVVGNVIGLLYFVVGWSGRGKGRTLGMKWLGIRVVRTDGRYLSLGRSFLRFIALGLSFIALFIGVIWVAFDKDKQGWHDKLADTYVVRA